MTRTKTVTDFTHFRIFCDTRKKTPRIYGIFITQVSSTTYMIVLFLKNVYANKKRYSQKNENLEINVQIWELKNKCPVVRTYCTVPGKNIERHEFTDSLSTAVFLLSLRNSPFLCLSMYLEMIFDRWTALPMYLDMICILSTQNQEPNIRSCPETVLVVRVWN